MLHTIAHYGFIVALICSAVCGVIMLILLAAYLDTEPAKRRELVWEVPVTVAGLGTFWTAVAIGLHLL